MTAAPKKSVRRLSLHSHPLTDFDRKYEPEDVTELACTSDEFQSCVKAERFTVVPAADYDAERQAREKAETLYKEWHRAFGEYKRAAEARESALRDEIAALSGELQKWICSEICGGVHSQRCKELSRGAGGEGR